MINGCCGRLMRRSGWGSTNPPSLSVLFASRIGSFDLRQQRWAGHNRWSQIKKAKGQNDVARAKLLSKTSTQIITSIKLANGQTDQNPLLTAALQQAKAIQMPKANLEMAMKKGLVAAGVLESSALGEKVEEPEILIYEGLAPPPLPLAFIVQAQTTNRNRAFAEIRHIFTKHSGTLTPVSYLFSKVSKVTVAKVVNPSSFSPQPSSLSKALETPSTFDTFSEPLLESALELSGIQNISEPSIRISNPKDATSSPFLIPLSPPSEHQRALEEFTDSRNPMRGMGWTDLKVELVLDLYSEPANLATLSKSAQEANGVWNVESVEPIWYLPSGDAESGGMVDVDAVLEGMSEEAGKEARNVLEKIMEALEAQEDVNGVWHNGKGI
ncbi:hypothetical protein HDV05_002113 [Chytridiales sp. JEL 0842]|nr:hypothetical protein HDV05_002113 [Chytridiales sp. JEL 0842]